METALALPRKIRFYLTQEGKNFECSSSAKTWGDLRLEVERSDDPAIPKGLRFDKKAITVRETRNNLKHDAAILPEGNFSLFLYPEESKSGANLRSEIEALGYNKGRTIAKLLKKKFGVNIDTSASKEEILLGIQDTLDENSMSLGDLEDGKVTSKEVSLYPNPKKKAKVSIKEKLRDKKKPVDDDVSELKPEDYVKATVATTGLIHPMICIDNGTLSTIFDAAIRTASLPEDRDIPSIRELAEKVAKLKSLELGKDIELAEMAEKQIAERKAAEEKANLEREEAARIEAERLRREEAKRREDREAFEEAERLLRNG